MSNALDPASRSFHTFDNMARALPAVMELVAGLTPGQWAMVRARLDALVGQPHDAAAAAGDLLPIFELQPMRCHAVI